MFRALIFSVFLLVGLSSNAREPEYCGYNNHNTVNEPFASLICCICEGCEYPPVERIGWFVNSNNKTCKDYDSEFIGTIPAQSEYCYEMQNHHRDTCCNLTCEPPKIKQVWEPVKPPFDWGSEPICNLCDNEQFPTKPYTITTVANIPGHPTCEDLYWMGRTGNIPEATCYPLQLYMREPCGCAPPSAPPRGDEPICDICLDTSYPLRPKIRINELARSPSCRDLYWLGLAGQLSPTICQHVQKRSKKPCGCLPM